MKKLRIPVILIASLVVLAQIGCKSPMQVTNNSANASGPFVVVNTDPTSQLTLMDSTGKTLTSI